MSTFEELKREVEAKNGIAMTSMHALRDMVGHKALGSDVIARISGRLHNVGLGHLPTKFRSPGDLPVTIYAMGTPAGDLVEAVVKMAEQRCDENDYHGAADLSRALDVVRSTVATPQNDALEIVAKIRALVHEVSIGDEKA